ncbi:hypothetical protein M440DRAFT_80155 [Trichoderma longibrachiatum ATCC 18648]|uniref:Uncharacterized protein n=1 Tax=Trichoderma longibrachiatum ATCC 18648 TaxID=983965 RepID=A0A2T4CIA4_TRILO|nr:hypothetical protein M440DRAFT_80155 [Trichoderma longibrachiatum ATCC 18648]
MSSTPSPSSSSSLHLPSHRVTNQSQRWRSWTWTLILLWALFLSGDGNRGLDCSDPCMAGKLLRCLPRRLTCSRRCLGSAFDFAVASPAASVGPNDSSARVALPCPGLPLGRFM